MEPDASYVSSDFTEELGEQLRLAALRRQQLADDTDAERRYEGKVPHSFFHHRP